MRDIITLPLAGGEEWVIATDNSGAIGEKALDEVKADYETLAYFSFRVAAMECLAAGASLESILLHNFCGEKAWSRLRAGIEKGLAELGLGDIPFIGSTESNFDLKQSAMGITVMGKRPLPSPDFMSSLPDWELAVVGTPLVGDEVMAQQEKIAPLGVFSQLLALDDVVLLPLGSKGIFHELSRLPAGKFKRPEEVVSSVDIFKSAGPATAFLIVYPAWLTKEIKNRCQEWFHAIERREFYEENRV